MAAIRRVDKLRHIGLFSAVTATLIIRQIKALPSREQAKVRRYIYQQHLPNARTRAVLKEVASGRKLIQCRDADELFAKLKI